MPDRELPEGWEEAPIGVFCIDIEQRVPGENEMFFYIDIGSVDRNTKAITGPTELLGIDAPSRARKCVREGDVLVSMTRPNLNAVALVPPELDGHIASTGFDVLRCPDLDCRWLFFLVRTKEFVETMSNLVQGALYPAVKAKDIRSFVIPVAPINEQRRITASLETTLAAVDACRQRLNGVAAILKRFRQAVLAAATTGELTREWREERGESVEPWKTVKTKEAGKIQLGRQRSPKYHSGPTMRPYLRVQNVFEDRIDLDDVMEMDFSGADLEKYKLHPYDILLNEGQSPQYLGRPAMYRGELPGACFTNSLIRFQARNSVVPDFALLVFRHCMHSGRYVSEGTITTNIAHLSAGRFGEVEFPLPSQDEQTEIVRRAQELFTLADRLEAKLTAARKSVDRLTPALLAKAFRGELVPQDPNDQPASELLAKLKAQQSNAAAASRPKRSKTHRKPPSMTISDKDAIKAAILNLKSDHFSFDELRAQAGGDYESLKTALFELLEDTRPVVRQVFDDQVKAILLERVKE
jgi:type I restriction enzyme S subunit